MKKTNKEIEKGWTQLSLKYRQWEDLQVKGRMRMKKKRNKDGKQYYDFDFSRYQYYYSYPEDHIGIASPANQKEFINYILEKTSENPTNKYVSNQQQNWEEIQNILKPLQLHQFLRDINDQINEKLSSLRIQKALRIKKMKGLFGPQNEFQKSMIQLIESQIRSLSHKKMRVQNKYSLFGAPYQQRLKVLQSNLKTRGFDEYQFSQIAKGDFIVFLRIRQVKQILSFNTQVLIKIILNLLERDQCKMKSKFLLKKGLKVSNRKKEQQKQKLRISDRLIESINQNYPNFFEDNQDSKTKLQELIESLDYIKCLQKNVQESQPQKFYSKYLTTLKINYDEVKYVPFTMQQLKQRLKEKIEYYFNQKLIDQEILNGSQEHICYKVNNLCFLQLKVLWQTYNYAHKKEESSLFKIRAMMKKELELVYSRHIDNLLNIRQHSIKAPASEKWMKNFLYTYRPRNQKQSIMDSQIKIETRFKDPIISSLISLLGVNKDTVVREQIQKFVKKSMKAGQKLYQSKILYYENCCIDQKTHIVNVLNKNISIKQNAADPVMQFYFKILHHLPKQQAIDFNFYRTYYMLVFLRCSEYRFQVLQILNAQLMCIMKVQNRIKMLWKKTKIPFQMSKQFIDRFVDSAENNLSGFGFVNAESSQSHIDAIFNQMYIEQTDKDYINWNAQIGVQVRRRRSDNPLLQGKSVIYEQAYVLLEDCLTRIQFVCSQSIKKRETYQCEGKLTEIVDRFQILYQYLAHQHNLQMAKLKILNLYSEQINRLINPNGIRLIYQEMNKIINYNNIVDLTQHHFSECYENQIQVMNAKQKILDLLIKKQQKFQAEYTQKSFKQVSLSNFGNTQPEISSMYYTEQITIQQDNNSIIEQAALQDQSNSMHSDTQSEVNQANGRHKTISEVSSLVDASQYHLRFSFQEVLSKNNIEKIKQENNKKQQILNKKKQRIINDSLLGMLIPRNKPEHNNTQFYYCSHFAAEVMRKIEQTLIDYSLGPQNQIKAFFLQEIYEMVENYTFQQFRQLTKPQELPVCFNWAFKTLNKFVQRAKNQDVVSSRASSEHWLCLNSKIMENILSNQSGQQLDQLRGLYLCLNTFHGNEINFKMKQLQTIEESKYSQFKLFSHILSSNSSGQIDKKQYPLNAPSYFQKRVLTFFKLCSDLKQSGELAYLSIGNYHQYFKAISAFDLAMHNLITALNFVFRSLISEVQSVEAELSLMEKYQCCFDLFSVLHVVPGIENRVNLRKKLQFINSYKKTIIPKQLSTQIVEILQSSCRSLPKFRKVQAKMSLSSMASTAYDFQLYIQQIMKSSILINMMAQQLRSQVQSKGEIKKLKEVSRVLPAIQKHLLISLLPNVSIPNIFNEQRELFFHKQSKFGKQIKLTVAQDKISIQRIHDYVFGMSDQLLTWIRQQYIRRKKDQLLNDIKKVQFNKFIDRHFPSHRCVSRSLLKQKVYPCMKDSNKCKNIIILRQWIESQLLIFGCGLNNQQLLKYRKMLCNPNIIFHVFWENNIDNLIGPKQLSKLKLQNVDPKDIVSVYKQNYLSYAHLKKNYKNFVEDLNEFDLQAEGADSFLILYAGASQFFNSKFQDWDFLLNFCDPFLSKPKTSVDELCDFVDQSNFCQYRKKSRFFDSKNAKKYYDLNCLKYQLWNSDNKKKVYKMDSARRFIKQRLTETKSLAVRQIKDEVSIAFYRSQRIGQVLQFLKIDPKQQQLALQNFKQNFDKYIHEGQIILNAKELFIFNMTEKSNEVKAQFIRVKEDILKLIMTNQFNLKLIRQKFYSFCSQALDNQLKLRKILQQDLQNEEVSRDNRILKQTINKILVPKVKLNPFLASPLKIQNHFFAGTIKLSFIDQFLNKLRNRAVMIELAEGGTGYLLKVNQLDQSVDVLCKAIIGFSEKQFSDRFRTVFDCLQETKQRNVRLIQQNKNYKAILKALKQYENKQVKSMLYEKLNDYIVTFYQRQKTYSVLMNLLKSIQNKMQSQINKKYQSKLVQLQFRNKQLQQKLDKVRDDCYQAIKSNTNQAKDLLFDSFKKKAESILNKNFINEIKSQQRFQQIQNQDSQILLRKLMMQKSFYQLKIAKTQSHLNQKIKSLQKKLLQQSKIQNLLLMEQQKNKGLTKQVKELQKCSIQNELLKKQMNKKQQEGTMQKFRLVKINQSLKGKMKRMEDQVQLQKSALKTQIQDIVKNQSKNKTSYSVQVSSNQKDRSRMKRRTFHIKTQSNSGPNIFDLNVWKQKWIKSERKNQLLIDGLKKTYEHYIFTKNGAKLVENLKGMLGQYQIKRAESLTQSIYK